MRRAAASLLIFTLTGSLPAQVAASEPRLPGFTTQSEPSEVSWEQRFKLLPDPQRMRTISGSLSYAEDAVAGDDRALEVLRQT